MAMRKTTRKTKTKWTYPFEYCISPNMLFMTISIVSIVLWVPGSPVYTQFLNKNDPFLHT